MLVDAGLLHAHNHPFSFGPSYEGLVIDDYFSVSCQALCHDQRPQCLDHLAAATSTYQREQVLGSPEKDVVGSQHFAVVGAEINSSKQVRSRGGVLVAASLAKRLSLISLSLRVAALPIISRGLASRLSGTWTSVLMFRRCLVSVLGGIYKLGVIDGKREDEVLVLSRGTAEELVLRSNVQVPYCDRVFASRAVGEDVAKTIWLGGDKRGAYTKLDNPFLGCVEEPWFWS